MITNNRTRTIGLIIGIIIVLILIWLSIILGLTKVTTGMLMDAIYRFDGSNEHIIIQDTRIPRAFIAAAVGASLAISGTIMQGLTNNPLASPGILGINAGASFFVVFGLSFMGLSSLTAFTWLAFLGAAVAAVVVYVFGSMGSEGMTPIKITLAGAAIAAMFSSMTQGMLTLNEQALDQVLFWLAGSIQGRDLDILVAVLPYLIAGLLSSLLIGRQMNVLAMGEDLAKGLGQKTMLVKMMGALIVVLLAGGSVAVAGPIGFVGIIIPHFARWLVGIDYRWVIPYSAVLGAVLLLAADIGARYILMPSEVPVGVMTVIVGAPFFVYIARRGISE
ncbi:iron ABC transporter permease [Planococcus sp. CP5-4]|uniref:FecCD family ABC transporter permease n=1 Tax=unclassified Planococcus (in: firmicutes) TaxID=2662419 RepID=UPI001C21C867|nr:MULTISPECIES: iron ABC transporter permease [unclassified Planococcus (in: firmicutes)]MBU9671809.1 iron ABC transporter permease [Planococcus sp. CP5-4_YE]MBV0909129.1 iron ABC transporter permease [Planococcus sp. CP5-4_UN]MBW6063621.1 iron ABC transporter permease [Planococcus sp. CP5-4]